ncbi:WXG100 family type VII secretion target [Streptomyces sp. NPDC093970]|uniref:WXG100 family type VII secretion target n=1 Tax=Streptomyces sp. NPDC093970 TaxID=3155076 RepID=UPI003419A9FA
MATYVYEPQTMADVANDMKVITTDIETLNTTLFTNVSSQIEEWSDDAKTLFDQRRADMNRAIADMATKAGVAPTALVAIGETYDGATSAGRKMWS